MPLVAAVVFGLGAGDAHADLSKKVIAAFKGKILVSKGELEPAGDDKSTIDKFKKEALTEVVGSPNADDAVEWSFVYTAFLKGSGATSLELEFHDGGQLKANKTLSGVDPKLTVLNGDITISEDDGLTKGKKYTLKLVGSVKGKEVVFATSTLSMK
ncbi:MAG TPA: hypothetical protein VM734_20090 [Kofleriaceae bacterium]|nr:hypothetical protein [Kofleriaceae bacterium]